MAFYYDDEGDVAALAEPSDVYEKDQRIFDANESLTEAVILAGLERATDRIATKLKSSSWWRAVNPTYTMSSLPDVNLNLIIKRQEDFVDLCVFVALADYILPAVADFGEEDSAERQKMKYYSQRSDFLFIEIMTAGDWYDTDNDGEIQTDELKPTTFNLKRIR